MLRVPVLQVPVMSASRSLGASATQSLQPLQVAMGAAGLSALSPQAPLRLPGLSGFSPQILLGLAGLNHFRQQVRLRTRSSNKSGTGKSLFEVRGFVLVL